MIYVSHYNYSNTENNNNYSVMQRSFRSASKNKKNIFLTPYKKRKNLSIYSYDIQNTIYKQLNNLNKYANKCNNRLIDFVEHSDKVIKKLNHSLNKREKEKEKEKAKLNLKLLLRDKNCSHIKKLKKIDNIKIMIKNVKKEVGIFDKFDFSIKRKQKSTNKISSLSNDTIKFFYNRNPNSEENISRNAKYGKEEKKNEYNNSIKKINNGITRKGHIKIKKRKH